MDYKIFRVIRYTPTSKASHHGSPIPKDFKSINSAINDEIPDTFALKYVAEVPEDIFPDRSGNEFFEVEEIEVTERIVKRHFYSKRK